MAERCFVDLCMSVVMPVVMIVRIMHMVVRCRSVVFVEHAEAVSGREIGGRQDIDR